MKHRAVSAAAAVLLIASCAGTTGGGPGDSSNRSTATVARAAAVGIIVEGCSLATNVGSGVVVGAPGQVVTVAHTVSGASSITVVAEDGTEHVAVVDAFDPDADLAVLDVPSLGVTPLAVADGPIALDDATVFGWSPDGGVGAIPVEVTRRLVITIEDIYVENEVTRTGMELAGDIGVGVSGAAVVDADGAVAGIVYARSRRRAAIGFATDVEELQGLLTERPQGDPERCRT